MGDHKREEVKAVLGNQRSEHFYNYEPQFHHPAYAQPSPGYPAPNQNYYDYQANYYPNYPNARPMPYVSPDTSAGFSFVRVMLCLLLFFILFALIMSAFTYLLFGSLVPMLKVESFNVRTFDVSNGTVMKASWDTKISIKNSNRRAVIMLEHAESTLVYRYVALDTSRVDHMEVPKESTAYILDGFGFPNLKRGFTGDSVMMEMAKDHSKGEITFDLRLDIETTLKSGMYSKRNKFRLYCEKLTMEVKNGSPIPVWKDSSRECTYG